MCKITPIIFHPENELWMQIRESETLYILQQQSASDRHTYLNLKSSVARMAIQPRFDALFANQTEQAPVGYISQGNIFMP